MMREVPTYANAAQATPPDFYNLEARLDGVVQQQVVEVNVDQGWARVHVLDAKGRPVLKVEGDARQYALRRVEGTWTLNWRNDC